MLLCCHVCLVVSLVGHGGVSPECCERAIQVGPVHVPKFYPHCAFGFRVTGHEASTWIFQSSATLVAERPTDVDTTATSEIA